MNVQFAKEHIKNILLKLPRSWRATSLYVVAVALKQTYKKLKSTRKRASYEVCVLGRSFLSEFIHLKRDSQQSFILSVGIYNLKFRKY